MEGRIIKALSGYYYVDTGEELVTCRRIMRPAYRAVTTHGQYIPMEQRTPHIQ